jgi:hypothetical protein
MGEMRRKRDREREREVQAGNTISELRCAVSVSAVQVCDIIVYWKHFTICRGTCRRYVCALGVQFRVQVF